MESYLGLYALHKCTRLTCVFHRLTVQHFFDVKILIVTNSNTRHQAYTIT